MSKNTYRSGMESIYRYLRQQAITIHPIHRTEQKEVPLAIKDAAKSATPPIAGDKVYLDHIVGIAVSDMTPDGKISVLIDPPYFQTTDCKQLTFYDYEELVTGEALKFHEQCECGRCRSCYENFWALKNL